MFRLRADDTWLQPGSFSAVPDSTLVLELTSGAEFATPETAIKPERLARAVGRLAGEPVEFGTPALAEKSLQVEATLPQPGIAALALELKPRRLEFDDASIESHFRELHAADDLRATWAALPAPRHWRENYTRHAQTFIRVGDPAPEDRGWAKPLGLALEFVPERDPTTLRAGEHFSLRVLRNGAPALGFFLNVVSAGASREHVLVTDEQGRASVVLDVRGLWLVHGADLRRAVASDRDWDSNVTSLTLEVK